MKLVVGSLGDKESPNIEELAKIRWGASKGSHDNFGAHRKMHSLPCSWACLRDNLFCKYNLELRQYDIREEKTTFQIYFKIFIIGMQKPNTTVNQIIYFF